MRNCLGTGLAVLVLMAAAFSRAEEKIPLYEADVTPTFVDLNAGESFRFRLKSGQERLVRLEAVRLIERSTYDYGVEADVVVDGHPLKLARWFASTKGFEPPAAVNGMRIALEIARAVDEHFKDKDGENERVGYWTRLEKDARLLVNDLSMPLWPGVRTMWDDDDLQFTADEIAYRTHTFFGRRDHDTGPRPAAMGRIHNDLDVAFAVGTPQYAPFAATVGFLGPIQIGLDTPALGREGRSYQVRFGHISRAFRRPSDACEAGEKVALSGDEQAGSIAHTHLAMIEVSKDEQSVDPMMRYMKCRHINPWWLIWQGFENERARRGLAAARMSPLSPAKTGAAVAFSSAGSTGAVRWDFGDGETSADREPKHAYDAPGIYAVRLTASDRGARHFVSQFITVEGPAGATKRARRAPLKAMAEVAMQAVADAQVCDHKDFANRNFGGDAAIALHAGRGHFDPWPNYGGNKFGLVRFERPEGEVLSARLRIFVSAESPNAFYVVPVADDAWEEMKVTFASAPNLYRPQPIGVMEGKPAGWHELDVTDYVNERPAAGAKGISFGLRAVACDTPDLTVDSREGKNPPQLVVERRKREPQ